MESTEDRIRSRRLRRLPVYLFEELAATRRRKEAAGCDVIDLSIGDPDCGAPRAALEALTEYASDSRLHCYTPHWAVEIFNRAIAGWMKKRFEVDLDPEREILPVIGTKEGIGHLPLAVLDPGDTALVPEPGYPVYSRGVWFAGADVTWMPLEAGAGYLPDLDAHRRSGARLLFLNYPNNPTSAVVGLAFFARAQEAARAIGAIAVNDAAYSEIAFDGYRAASLLQVEGWKERTLEFHSFSKTFSMAGWRVGWAAGSRDVVGALGALKSNLDSGVFGAVLLAAAKVLTEGWPDSEETMREYSVRRKTLFDCLEVSGLRYHRSPATLYLWVEVPGGGDSMEFAKMLLDEAGVLVAPGVGFGPHGEGYFRMSLTCATGRISDAARRIGEVSDRWTS